MSNPQHEPTMEEILASIRKIISEDAPEGGAPAEAAPVAQAEPPAPPPPNDAPAETAMSGLSGQRVIPPVRGSANRAGTPPPTAFSKTTPKESR